MALGLLTAFPGAAANGVAGEMSKQSPLSTGALANRTLGWETPLPTGIDGLETLASQVHARVGDGPRRPAEWASLLCGAPSREWITSAARPVIPPRCCPVLYVAGYRAPGQAPTQTRVMALM
ncbi:hypothetical protein ACIQVN_29455 [Streptomyces cyaneofuscatus]|uniref:hypothetical protein n=1 Tax=Streptomyces cyaneofuscatus TaxID=66883 RepID=UPI00381B2A2B